MQDDTVEKSIDADTDEGEAANQIILGEALLENDALKRKITELEESNEINKSQLPESTKNKKLKSIFGTAAMLEKASKKIGLPVDMCLKILEAARAEEKKEKAFQNIGAGCQEDLEKMKKLHLNFWNDRLKGN